MMLPTLRSPLPASRPALIATSAPVVGGCWRGVRQRGVSRRTAQRDDIDKTEALAASQDHAKQDTVYFESTTTSSGSRSLNSAPLPFGNAARLPVLACNPKEPSNCVNLTSIGDPCLDDSLDLKVFEYLDQMVAGGMTAERAAAVVAQWSSGGGAAAVDLAKLRSYFLRTTLESVMWQQLPPVASLGSLTALAYWSLGQLPGADEALLHPALRGALVAVNLLLLVSCASGSLKHSGRLLRVGRAALDFSSRAELVLLALEDLANGHGSLIQAARSPQASAGPPGSSGSLVSGRLQRGATQPPLSAVHRHAARQRILDACRQVMAFAKEQALTEAGAGAGAGAGPRAGAAPDVVGGSGGGGGAVTVTRAADAAPAPPLSSLDSFLVLQAAAATAAAGCGGGSAEGTTFDAASELGLSQEEVAAAARMYARFGDRGLGGRIGDYELRRLLQESGAPALSEDERRLALAVHSADRRAWLTFRDWVTWWAADTDRRPAPGSSSGPAPGPAAGAHSPAGSSTAV